MKTRAFLVLLLLCSGQLVGCEESSSARPTPPTGGDGSTGDGETGDGETGDGETGDGETGDGSTGDGETGDGETGDGETGDGTGDGDGDGTGDGDGDGTGDGDGDGTGDGTGDGDGDGETGDGGDGRRELSSLTQAERDAYCEQSRNHVTQPAILAGVCSAFGVFAETFGGGNCEETREACVTQAYTCTLETEGCDALVDDLEVCFAEQRAQLEALEPVTCDTVVMDIRQLSAPTCDIVLAACPNVFGEDE